MCDETRFHTTPALQPCVCLGCVVSMTSCSELWTRATNTPPPSGPLWHLQLPDMCAQAVVTRMLSNLHTLHADHRSNAAPHAGVVVLSTPSVPLVQLVSFVCGHDTLRPVPIPHRSQLQETACGRGELFHALLEQQKHLLQQVMLWSLCHYQECW